MLKLFYFLAFFIPTFDCKRNLRNMKRQVVLVVLMLVGINSLRAQIDFSKKNTVQEPLFDAMSAQIEAGTYERITSVLIARDGKLIYEHYFNGNTEDSKHNTRSATKTVATLLTGVAIDQGFIASEKDFLFKYLKHKMPVQNPDARKTKITLEDILSMSSILECDDDNGFSRGNEERMYIIEDWPQFLVDLPVKSYPFGPKPNELPYGRMMSYCSAGAAVMAEVVQEAVGMKATDFYKKNLLEPLGISDMTLHYTPTGTLNTAGGSEYRSRDLLKLIQLCLQKGKWDGQQLISADWIEKATTPKVNAWEGMDYGYLLWLRNFGSGEGVKSYAMSGNGGNKVVAFPALNTTVVLTTRNYNNRKAHGYTDELLNKYIVPALQR